MKIKEKPMPKNKKGIIVFKTDAEKALVKMFADLDERVRAIEKLLFKIIEED